jgi:hypothetical protein
MFRRLGRTHRSRYANRGWALTRSLAARLLNCWPETESPWKKADKVALQAATLVQNMRPPAWADRRAAAASVRHAGRPADVASEKGWWNVGQPQPIAPAPVPAAMPRVSLAELWPREANLALAQACARAAARPSRSRSSSTGSAASSAYFMHAGLRAGGRSQDGRDFKLTHYPLNREDQPRGPLP